MSTHHESTNEPVAWMQPDEVHISLWKDEYHTVPLYTHPQAVLSVHDQKKDEAFRMEHALRLALEAAQLGLDYAKSEQYENKHRYKGYEHLAPDDAYCIGVFEKAITLIEQALEKRK